MVNSSQHTSESFGIKNSASLEEIRNDETFQFLSEFIKKNWIERETKEFNGEERILIGSDPDFKDKYWFLSDSIASWTIEWISLNEIRNLKQALNNQICLYVFHKFLDQISDFKDCEIPCIRKWEDESIEVYPITTKEFVRLDEAAKNVSVISELHKFPPALLQFWTSFNGRILAFIQSKEAKARIIWHFLDLFTKVIVVFFEQKVNAIFQKKSGESIQDIVELYLFLEHFVVYHTSERKSQPLTSFTQYIVLNHNNNYIGRFLIESAQKNNKIPTKQEIKLFLSRQTKHHTKTIRDSKSTHMHNTDQIEYDVQEWVFSALENGVWDSWSKELDSLWWCPFAKSQIEWTKDNAFLKMFETFDEYYLMIIEELNKRWFK